MSPNEMEESTSYGILVCMVSFEEHLDNKLSFGFYLYLCSFLFSSFLSFSYLFIFPIAAWG